MKSPCKDCQRRTLGCHNVDACPEWREYVESVQAEKAKRREVRMEQEAWGAHLKRRGYTPPMR